MRTLVLALGLAFSAPALQANDFCDTPGKLDELKQTLDAPWKAFKANRIDEVERFYSGLIARHEAGALDDTYLGRAFDYFNCSNPSCGPLLLNWIRAYPNSAAAHLAMAQAQTAVGYAARGQEFADKTSEAQFLAMGEAFRKAFEELEQADRLVKKPTLSASLRILMAPTSRNIRPDATQLYRTAIKAHPETLQVRILYVRASAPRWGGSVRQLMSIVDDARSLPAADRRYIEYLVLQEIGVAYDYMKDYTQAATYYEKSVPLCPGLEQSARWLMEAQWKARNLPGLEAAATQYIARYPRNGLGYVQRALSYVDRQRYREALADFEKATQLGYGYAYMQLGGMYEMGHGVARDYARALELFLIAENLGVEGARGNADRVRKSLGAAAK